MTVLIYRLLIHSRSKTKYILSVLGVLIGLFVVTSVFQLYFDFNYLLKNNNSESDFEYLQISKEVRISTSLGLSSSNFSVAEIEKIKSKSFISDVGCLFSNDFRVTGRFAGNSFDMFFTSIKNSFIDTELSEFKWSHLDDIVPIIVSNQFLTLLNHAVLPSQGQKPIPKIAIKQVIVNLKLSKGQNRLNTKARVVGFSDRISSVIVPQEFLNFANKELSGKKDSRVSMLVLKVTDAGSKLLIDFLSENGYEISGGIPLMDSAKSTLEIVIVLLFVFGGLILVLSVALNITQLKMIILENNSHIKMLVLLGYSPKVIANSLLKFVSYVLVGSLFVVFFSVKLVFTFIHTIIEVHNLGQPKLNIITFIIPLILIVILISILNRGFKKQINQES